MPHLRVRGIEFDELEMVYNDIISDLVEIIDCPRDHFTLEHINSTYIVEEDGLEKYPYVEVLWFNRSHNVMDEVAMAITKVLKANNHDYVTVVFNNLEKDKYYENGKHF